VQPNGQQATRVLLHQLAARRDPGGRLVGRLAPPDEPLHLAELIPKRVSGVELFQATPSAVGRIFALETLDNSG
jgi:hypothetical protein